MANVANSKLKSLPIPESFVAHHDQGILFGVSTDSEPNCNIVQAKMCHIRQQRLSSRVRERCE